MRRLHLAAASAASILALLAPGAAGAHGPCGCTSPPVAEPGQRVRTGTAYKIIWNPAPRDFRNQTTPPDLASGYRADAPTVTVLRRPRKRPLRRATFRVPSGTPPGIYFVMVFDGSEGGAHTTWDYVQIRGRPRTAAAASTAEDARPTDVRAGTRRPLAVLGSGAVAFFIVAGTVLARRRRGPAFRPRDP